MSEGKWYENDGCIESGSSAYFVEVIELDSTVRSDSLRDWKIMGPYLFWFHNPAH